MNLIAKIFFVAVFITEAVRSAALAQTQAAGDCADPSPKPPNQTLSDRLDQSNGVIYPPNVDPAMRKPTPQTGGDTPVIPPPGGPGGNSDVQPK